MMTYMVSPAATTYVNGLFLGYEQSCGLCGSLNFVFAYGKNLFRIGGNNKISIDQDD